MAHRGQKPARDGPPHKHGRQEFDPQHLELLNHLARLLAEEVQRLLSEDDRGKRPRKRRGGL